MSYRNDHDAAVARISSLEQELEDRRFRDDQRAKRIARLEAQLRDRDAPKLTELPPLREDWVSEGTVSKKKAKAPTELSFLSQIAICVGLIFVLSIIANGGIH